MQTIEFYTLVAQALQMVRKYVQTKDSNIIREHTDVLMKIDAEIKRIEKAKGGDVPWLK